MSQILQIRKWSHPGAAPTLGLHAPGAMMTVVNTNSFKLLVRVDLIWDHLIAPPLKMHLGGGLGYCTQALSAILETFPPPSVHFYGLGFFHFSTFFAFLLEIKQAPAGMCQLLFKLKKKYLRGGQLFWNRTQVRVNLKLSQKRTRCVWGRGVSSPSPKAGVMS